MAGGWPHQGGSAACVHCKREVCDRCWDFHRISKQITGPPGCHVCQEHVSGFRGKYVKYDKPIRQPLLPGLTFYFD